MKLMGASMMGVFIGLFTVSAVVLTLTPGLATATPSRAAAPATTDSQHVKGEIIIKLKGTLSAAERDAALKTLGLTSVQRLEGINADLVRIHEGESVEEALERLKKKPSVEFVEPNYRVRIQ